MTTITLEVPDELATRLLPLRAQLPQLLATALELWPDHAPFVMTEHPLFEDLLNLLVSRPTPEKIIAFKVSPSVQTRLDELLDKQREEGLTAEERAELDAYEQLNVLVVLLKARARWSLAALN